MLWLPATPACIALLLAARRWLWLAAQRKPWNPEIHAAFPPAFKRAACTLLLVAHRGAALAAAADADADAPPSGAAHLARLPAELLLRILARAAYPLSPWRPEMDGGHVLEEVRRWEPPYDSDLDGPYGYHEYYGDYGF